VVWCLRTVKIHKFELNNNREKIVENYVKLTYPQVEVVLQCTKECYYHAQRCNRSSSLIKLLSEKSGNPFVRLYKLWFLVYKFCLVLLLLLLLYCCV